MNAFIVGFFFLMYQTGLTRGNRSSHTSNLAAAGYIEIEEFVDRKPHTMFGLADAGGGLSGSTMGMMQVLR